MVELWSRQASEPPAHPPAMGDHIHVIWPVFNGCIKTDNSILRNTEIDISKLRIPYKVHSYQLFMRSVHKYMHYKEKQINLFLATVTLILTSGEEKGSARFQKWERALRGKCIPVIP